MKKILKIKHILMCLLLIFLLTPNYFLGHELAPFKQLTSYFTPDKKIYSVNGDFRMIENINILINHYDDSKANNDCILKYIDIDNYPNTLNSSSSTLLYSDENGAIPEYSNVVFAVLYWTAINNSKFTLDDFIIEQDGNKFDKRKIKIKHDDDTEYHEINENFIIFNDNVSNKDIESINNLYYNICPALYINDNGNIIITKQDPEYISVESDNINTLYNIHDSYPSAKMLIIHYNSDKNLSYKLDINKLSQFPNLKYLILTFDSDMCKTETSNCLKELSNYVLGNIQSALNNLIIGSTTIMNR